MAKKIKLTRRSEGKQIVEECYLVEEEDVVTIGGAAIEEALVDDEEKPLTTQGLFKMFSEQNWVVFEDEFGIFGVPAADVIKIDFL